MRCKNREGFTLLETSIVLVIIGLIVGSVLVGKDLIEAARIRAAVTQYEQYNTAEYAFMAKYNALPGDLANADRFGFTTSNTGNGVTAGNGLIESTNGVGESSPSRGGYETSLFWSHLSAANMIGSGLTPAGPSTIPDLSPVGTPVSAYFPVAKIGQGNYWAVYSVNGQNYYELASIVATSLGGNYFLGFHGNLTPAEALAIDQKLDDGLPLTGIVHANMGSGSFGSSCDPTGGVFATGTDGCCGDNVHGHNANIYTTATATLANTPSCLLSLRMQ